MRCAESNCRFIVAAHAHAEALETEVRSRALPETRNARRLLPRRAECTSSPAISSFNSSRHIATKAFASAGITPAFCGSSPVLTCTNSSRRCALLRHFIGNRLGNFRPVNGVDRVEQRDRVGGLVRLQRADQMQFQIGEFSAQLRPLSLRLLDAIFAKHALASKQARGEPRQH